MHGVVLRVMCAQVGGWGWCSGIGVGGTGVVSRVVPIIVLDRGKA